jgi:hypothetical protein
MHVPPIPVEHRGRRCVRRRAQTTRRVTSPTCNTVSAKICAIAFSNALRPSALITLAPSARQIIARQAHILLISNCRPFFRKVLRLH